MKTGCEVDDLLGGTCLFLGEVKREKEGGNLVCLGGNFRNVQGHHTKQ